MKQINLRNKEEINKELELCFNNAGFDAFDGNFMNGYRQGLMYSLGNEGIFDKFILTNKELNKIKDRIKTKN